MKTTSIRTQRDCSLAFKLMVVVKAGNMRNDLSTSFLLTLFFRKPQSQREQLVFALNDLDIVGNRLFLLVYDESIISPEPKNLLSKNKLQFDFIVTMTGGKILITELSEVMEERIICLATHTGDGYLILAADYYWKYHIPHDRNAIIYIFKGEIIQRSLYIVDTNIAPISTKAFIKSILWFFDNGRQDCYQVANIENGGGIFLYDKHATKYFDLFK